MGGMGGGKSPSIPSAPATPAEAPKVYQQEQEMNESAKAARDDQHKRAMAALGQEGTILTTPFGSQESTAQNQGKTLLG